MKGKSEEDDIGLISIGHYFVLLDLHYLALISVFYGVESQVVSLITCISDIVINLHFSKNDYHGIGPNYNLELMVRLD